MTSLPITDPSLVVLVGASGSGKSTFARAHFGPDEIVSSDRARAWVSGDEADQSASADAFEVLHLIVDKRLARNLLTVVDATSVEEEARAALLGIARRHHVKPIAVVLDLPEDECLAHDAARRDRRVPHDVIRRQRADLWRSLPALEEEGFARVHVLRSAAEAAAAVVTRVRRSCDRRDLRGPFDIVGDVHGCFDELAELMTTLGWTGLPEPGRAPDTAPRHPDGRTLVFLGDLVDRGPRITDVLRLALLMREAGTALVLTGNHETKLLKKLRGRDVKLKHGLEMTLEQLASQPPELTERVADWIDVTPSHYILDEGRLVVAHAGMKASLQGRWGKAVRAFAMYGETTGETDEYGLPVRYPWAKDYRGEAVVAYGHTPIPSTEWVNGTICLDTGCVFGGRLSALRWPEREIVHVVAKRVWYEPSKPFPRATGEDSSPPAPGA